MNSIYQLLQDRRTSFIGRRHWLGNLRWFAEEAEFAPAFIFRTSPVNASETEYAAEGDSDTASRRTLVGLQLKGTRALRECLYRPDEITADFEDSIFSLLLPLERYGGLVSLETRGSACLVIQTSGQAGRRTSGPPLFLETIGQNKIIWRDGGYTVVFRFTGNAEQQAGGGFSLIPPAGKELHLAIGFHTDHAKAVDEAEELFSERLGIQNESRAAWEDYLQSCPVADMGLNPVWKSIQDTARHGPEEIRRRQYWHWQCLLANVYELPGNELAAYIAPDKSTWFGSWSNDGPECLRALARTNRHALARKCIQEFVRTAITSAGDLAWYLHGTGEPCLGRHGDSGRLSHGVPTIVTAVADYIEATADMSLLDAPAGPGGTVWEKLYRYIRGVFDRRDQDGDGLVEWRNLWEGGADDKVGCFFSEMPIEEWIRAVTSFPEPLLRAFYQRNSRPVVNLYEQAFFLHALQSMERLAALKGDGEMANFARDHFAEICRVLRERHWDESDGFYYDWNVTQQELIRVKNQDAFYLLHFLDDPARTSRMVAHLNDPKEFGLFYIPTLAASSKAFSATGYWCGGYWPRESFYIARALSRVGHSGKALELLVRALCSGNGKVIHENMNPATGLPNTPIAALAYNSLLNLALQESIESSDGESLVQPALVS